MRPQTPTDRVAREFAGVLRGARARRPEDADDQSIPVAATVVVVRDGPSGLEVLLLERPDRGAFANAWVFPGGKLDDADRLAGAGEEADARRAGVRETAEETGLALAGEQLQTLSVWDPPPGIALRIRTWFFVALAPAGEVSVSPDEAVAARWRRPQDALAEHGRGELTLYPPTWVTLHGLTDRTDVGDVLDAARLSGVHRFETVARQGPNGTILLWQEDAEYDPDASAAASARHRLDVSTLPWRYSRTY